MYEKLKSLSESFKRELKVYRLILKDPRTPRSAKIFLTVAVGYAVSPIDLIPDFIPILGHLDDLIIIPLLVFLARRFIPKEVIQDCRAIVMSEESELNRR